MTRARSLPDRGTEGRGGGGSGSLCRLPRESSRRPRTKLRSQTQTINPAPGLKPTDQDASPQLRRPQTRHWRQNGGRRGRDSTAARAGSRDAIARSPAPRRSGRDGLGSVPRPPAGYARAFLRGLDRLGQEERGGEGGIRAASPAHPRPER